MPQPVFEKGAAQSLSQWGGDYTTPGKTKTYDFNIIPGFLVIHTGLSRVAEAEAAVGIVEYSVAEEGGGTVTFPNEAEWRSHLYKKVGHYTIGFYVARGVMKAWFYAQTWS